MNNPRTPNAKARSIGKPHKSGSHEAKRKVERSGGPSRSPNVDANDPDDVVTEPRERQPGPAPRPAPQRAAHAGAEAIRPRPQAADTVAKK